MRRFNCNHCDFVFPDYDGLFENVYKYHRLSTQQTGAASDTQKTSKEQDAIRASASCAVGQDGCRIDTWPRHTKDVIKMVPVATLLGAQHYKASTGFSSLTNHASLASHNEQKKNAW